MRAQIKVEQENFTVFSKTAAAGRIMLIILIWILAMPFSDGCTKKYTRNFRKFKRQRFGLLGKGRFGRTGDTTDCPEDRKYKLLPIQTVIENVYSWEECGQLIIFRLVRIA